MDMWLKITVAIVLGIMAWRLWPVARHLSKHGPRGSSDDWRAAVLAIAAVVGFVALLIVVVRG